MRKLGLTVPELLNRLERSMDSGSPAGLQISIYSCCVLRISRAMPHAPRAGRNKLAKLELTRTRFFPRAEPRWPPRCDRAGCCRSSAPNG